jgi:hypothetical protein
MNTENPFKLIFDQLSELNDKIDSLTVRPDALNFEDDLTDVIGASKLLKQKTGTTYNQVSRKEIPYHKKGGKLYFFKSELLEYVKTGKVKTRKEIAQEVEEKLSKIKEGALNGQNPKNTPNKELHKDSK